MRPHPHEIYNSLLYGDVLNEKLDFILPFENLQDAFNETLGYAGPGYITLPHKERQPHKHCSEIFTEVEKQLVADIFAEDISTFGYKY